MWTADELDAMNEAETFAPPTETPSEDRPFSKVSGPYESAVSVDRDFAAATAWGFES